MSMDKECKIVEEKVTETVCVTVMDQLVEEVGYMFKLGEAQTLFFISCFVNAFQLTTKKGCDIWST